MSALGGLFGVRRHSDAGEHWLSVSDLMAGLMMVFLLISVAFMLNLQEKVDAPVAAERELCRDLRNKLGERLGDALGTQFVIGDAGRSQGESTEQGLNCLTVRFLGLDGRFEQNQDALSPEFERTLDQFFLPYLDVLQEWEQDGEGRVVKEVRIEGHTSSEWNHESDIDDAYFENMRLSQGRTRSVLEHIHKSVSESSRHSDADAAWVRDRVRAVGYSSSQLVIRNGREDRDASRRVLFRVATNLEDVLRGIATESLTGSDAEE